MTDDLRYLFIPFAAKSKRDEKGHLIVKGRATDGTLDLDKQICDPAWLDKAMPEWFKIGNIREMHGPKAVGKAIEMSGSGKSGYDVGIKVIDKDAAEKCDEGVFTGLSIGIKGARIDTSAGAIAKAANGIITDGTIVEVSLVDRPANPNARLSFAKAADSGELENDESMVDGCPPCPDCDGTGKVKNGSEDCPMCDGTGEGTPVEVISGNIGDQQSQGQYKKAEPDPDCETCDGTGTIKDGNMDCPDCVQGKSLSDVFGFYGDAVVKGTEFEVYKKAYTDDERKQLASEGKAMPGGGYPIKTVADLKNAVQAFGRAKDPAATKAHIIKRAKALKRTDLLPEAWNVAKIVALRDLLAKVTLDKGATADQFLHDPGMLRTILEGLVECSITEWGEFLTGDDERSDVMSLSYITDQFLSWWEDEAIEGETVSPFKSSGAASMDALVSLGLEPDLVKSASATDATDEQKGALRAALVKTLGLEPEVIKSLFTEATKETIDKVESFASRLDKVEAMSAPNVVHKRAMEVYTKNESEVSILRSRADGLEKTAMEDGLDPVTRADYLDSAARLRMNASALTNNL